MGNFITGRKEAKKAFNVYITLNALFYLLFKIVEFNKKLESWKADHEKALIAAKSSLDSVEKELSVHYDTTRVIPVKYHDIGILEYIYSLISSSQYSLKECFDDYERDEARRLEEEKLKVAEAQARLTAQQNSLLDEQNEIAEKTRRDQNISNIVRGVQHHNTNKILRGK